MESVSISHESRVSYSRRGSACWVPKYLFFNPHLRDVAHTILATIPPISFTYWLKMISKGKWQWAGALGFWGQVPPWECIFLHTCTASGVFYSMEETLRNAPSRCAMKETQNDKEAHAMKCSSSHTTLDNRRCSRVRLFAKSPKAARKKEFGGSFKDFFFYDASRFVTPT